MQEDTSIRVTPEQEEYTITKDKVIDINCKYNPSNLTEQDFTWTASDADILSVYWNKVRGKKVGTTDIIIKSIDGKYEKRVKFVITESNINMN